MKSKWEPWRSLILVVVLASMILFGVGNVINLHRTQKPELNPMVISRDLEDGLVTILEEDFEDLLERSGATAKAYER